MPPIRCGRSNLGRRRRGRSNLGRRTRNATNQAIFQSNRTSQRREERNEIESIRISQSRATALLTTGTAPLPPAHLAILEPYCNKHITVEDGNTSDPESDTKDCGFQESIISDVENSEAVGSLVTGTDTSHSGLIEKTEPLPLTTALNEQGILRLEKDIKKERIACEEEELENYEMKIKEEVISYPESKDPLSSGVTYINLQIKEEPIEEEEIENHMEIEEDENVIIQKEVGENIIKQKEMGYEESLFEDKSKELEKCFKEEEVKISLGEYGCILINEPATSDSTLTLLCLSVRIGTFKIYPMSRDSMLDVSLSKNGLSFYSPVVSDGRISSSSEFDGIKRIKLTIRPQDVVHMLGFFGKCFPVLFVATTLKLAEVVRRSLNMRNPGSAYYDPTSRNPKMNKITFLLEDNTLTDGRSDFLRQYFTIKEINKQKANELLVLSTP